MNTPEHGTAFQVSGVTAGYGKQPVLKEVTLPSLASGELLGLLGPNASGKSTLLRCLSREMACEGEILLDGKPQQAYRHGEWQAKVASMPQAPPAPSALMPTELMWSTARALSLDLSDFELAGKIEGIFHRLGLIEAALSPLHSLSGGKRQLVGLALALIRDPLLLLLDEPTSALDLHWRMVVLDLLREELLSRGGIAVAALHDLDLAARYCDRLALLQDGRIIATGRPEDVLTQENLRAVYRIEAEVYRGPNDRLAIDIERPVSSV